MMNKPKEADYQYKFEYIQALEHYSAQLEQALTDACCELEVCHRNVYELVAEINRDRGVMVHIPKWKTSAQWKEQIVNNVH